MDSPEVTIIVPVFNEEPNNLDALRKRLDEVLRPLLLFYELIFVDDGSVQRTNLALRELVSQHPNCRLVVLSRNFGEVAAITAGLEHASGQVVINMDSDLQDPPELIPTMLQYWREGYDVVYTQQATRNEPYLRKAIAMAFYRVLSSVSSIEIPVDAGEFRLLSRRAVNALNSVPERSRFLRGLVPWIGFKQIGIPFNRAIRKDGQSQYSINKLVSLAIDGLLSFNVLPLYMVAILGVLMILSGSLGMLLHDLIPAAVMQVPTMLIMILLIFGGVQICCVGVVAVYLELILRETRARPVYIAAEKVGWDLPERIREGAYTQDQLNLVSRLRDE